MMKKFVLIAALLVAGCATSQKSPPADAGAGDAARSAEEILADGARLLGDGQRKRAIEEFDKAIALCESRLEAEASGKKVYASRGADESLAYMVMAAAAGEEAITIETPCADALYLRGFASLDSGLLEQAEEYIKRAVAISPLNSLYLSELGHIYNVKREWQRSVDAFRESEKFAETYSPPALKEQELARAKRGVGFGLIELGKIDEAEAKFRECLEIDRNDKNALHELEYIEELRSNPPPDPYSGSSASPPN
ncbi:MAG TPA: hypothetical protein VFX02_08710 [Gammaproteobacteria bacterium]|nr:hypothetical protein [Gammaproteobacteria bacterium]